MQSVHVITHVDGYVDVHVHERAFFCRRIPKRPKRICISTWLEAICMHPADCPAACFNL